VAFFVLYVFLNALTNTLSFIVMFNVFRDDVHSCILSAVMKMMMMMMINIE